MRPAPARVRHNGPVTSPRPLTDADRERIARRYPGRSSRKVTWVLGILATIVLATALLTWTVWAGLHGSRAPITAQIHGYQVVSATKVDAIIVVHRPDPARPAQCTLYAVSADHQRVGETTVTFAPSTHPDQTVHASVKTFSAAVTAQLESCRTTG